MKTCLNNVKHITLLLGSASLALSATSLLAADADSSGMVVPPPELRSGVYLGTEVGLNLADDLTGSGHTFLGPTTASVSFSPGVRWDLSLGYAIKLADQLTLGPEVEVGILYNPLDSVSGRAAGVSVSKSISGYLIQVPVMGNAVLRWQFSPGWVLYGGGGAGYDYCVLGVNNDDHIGHEGDFAWQAMVGLKYAFGPSEVGLGYKYLAVQPSGAKTVGNNSIMLSYTVHF